MLNRLATLGLAAGLATAGCGVERGEDQQADECVCTDPFVLSVDTPSSGEVWNFRYELVEEFEGSTEITGICAQCKAQLYIVTAEPADYSVAHDGELRYVEQAAPLLGFDQVGDKRKKVRLASKFATEGEITDAPFRVKIRVP